jgi:hypothetical protein
MKRSCDICRKHEARWKDYRFIDSCGLQGKTIVCKWCRELDDVAVAEIFRNEIDPKEFFNDRPN